MGPSVAPRCISMCGRCELCFCLSGVKDNKIFVQIGPMFVNVASSFYKMFFLTRYQFYVAIAVAACELHDARLKIVFFSL